MRGYTVRAPIPTTDRAPVRCSPLAGSTACPPLGGAILPDIDIAPQRHAGDMEGFANVLNGRGFVSVELFHHGDLFWSEDFSPTALASPGSCSGKPCLGALADDVALELRK